MGYSTAMQTATTLRARRPARDLTQKQLAAITGTAQPTISDIETGAVSASLDVCLRLLDTEVKSVTQSWFDISAAKARFTLSPRPRP